MNHTDSYSIERILAREILDSRGNPTVEVEVSTKGGFSGWAAVPSGASTGRFEAVELRDGDRSRLGGKGVLKAVLNVNKTIASKVKGLDCRQQMMIDNVMIDLDGTPNKGRLGANAILGVSLAVARTAAEGYHIPLYKYLGGTVANKLPVPMLNIINGGKHAGNDLAIQEFLIMPVSTNSFKESLIAAMQVYHILKERLRSQYGASSINVGDEGGFAPPLENTSQALEHIIAAIEESGYKSGKEIWIGVDAAASDFYSDREGTYTLDGLTLQGSELIDYYKKLVENFDLKSIEDPLNEDDFDGFAEITRSLGGSIQIVGDDLFVTNLERLKKGLEVGSANALLLKVNQIGTLTEAVEAADLSFKNGWRVIVSHRSGETEDSFISDLSVGLGAHMIKTGAPARGERTAKYNQLLRISDELSGTGDFWGKHL